MRFPRPSSPARLVLALPLIWAAASCTPDASRGVVAVRPQATPAGGVRAMAADPLPVLLDPAGPRTTTAALPAAPPFVSGDADAEDATRAVACLTEAVYYEARSEPLDGQRAVAQVVLNRVRNPAFPASVCGVVHQRSATSGTCQFSYVCDGSMRGRHDAAAWERAYRVAQDAYAGSVYAPAGSATFYHTTAVAPWWSTRLARIATIGAHIFYRLGDAVGARLDFRQAYAAAEPRSMVIESDAQRTATVTRFLTAGGTAVSVHRGADTIAGVVVHRGAPPAADAGATVAGIRVHRGTPADAGEAAPPAADPA